MLQNHMYGMITITYLYRKNKKKIYRNIGGCVLMEDYTSCFLFYNELVFSFGQQWMYDVFSTSLSLFFLAFYFFRKSCKCLQI